MDERRSRAAKPVIPLATEGSLADLYGQRAAILACSAATASNTTGHDRVVVFQLGDETYAVDLYALDRIFAHPNHAPVPGVNARWAGVFTAYGEIIPVLDLARVLNLAETQPDSGKHVLTIRGTARKLGLLVGRVLDIQDIPVTALRPIGNQARYVKGASPENVLVLDINLLTELSRSSLNESAD